MVKLLKQGVEGHYVLTVDDSLSIVESLSGDSNRTTGKGLVNPSPEHNPKDVQRVWHSFWRQVAEERSYEKENQIKGMVMSED